ncbi:MAG: sugar-binding domain-containing protein, partial [Mobilitalea sp.]
MTEHINLNNEWKYVDSFQIEMTQVDFDETNMKEIRLPHTNVETPYHYFDEKIYQFISCYRRHLKVCKDWKGKKILLTFEGIGHIAKIYINSRLIETHYGGYTAFTIDLAPYLKFPTEEADLDNILAVEVDSRESNNLPPFGFVIDYMTFGGIYREAYIDIKEEKYIEDVFIVTEDG